MWKKPNTSEVKLSSSESKLGNPEKNPNKATHKNPHEILHFLGRNPQSLNVDISSYLPILRL